MNYYYRDKSGQEIGPLTLDALAKLRFAGVLDGETPVRLAESNEWKPCRETIADPPPAQAAPVSAPTTPASGKPSPWLHGWSLFALAALCFLLPFLELSCSGKKVLTLTGKQLVTGTEVDQPADLFGRTEKKKIDPEPLAKWAVGLAAAALLLALARKPIACLVSGLAGMGGMVALAMLAIKIQDQIAKQRQEQELLQLQIKEGLWLAGALLFFGAVVQLKLFDLARTGKGLPGVVGWKLQRSHSVILAILALAAAVFFGGAVLHKSLSANTTLSFDFALDGKTIPAGKRPEITVDGQSFTSGDRISVGRHRVAVRLQDAEPLERNYWVFYGEKDLGTLPLESSKGTLAVTVNPSPAKVIIKQGGEIVRDGTAPLTVEKLPVGEYALVVSRGDYSETHSARIQRQQQTDAKIELKLGGVELSSAPADAEFELSGNGRRWQGKLPMRIEDVPVGTYRLNTRRKGWELSADVSVGRGVTATNQTEFPYSSIEVTSEPSGLIVSTNGVEIGKTPLTLQEMKPGQHALSVTDGENDLMASVTVGPKETAKQAFKFRYGSVQLSSTPPGATVIRKGKETGKTPLKLERVPAGESAVALKLDGYVTTNFALHVVEGETASLTAKLVSERYVQAMKQAREAFAAGQIAEAQNNIAAALEVEPDDKQAKALRSEVSFQIHYQKAEGLVTGKQWGEALMELAEAEKLRPDSDNVPKLRQQIQKQKLEQFSSFVQSAENSLSRGQTDEAIQVLNEAEKLIANNSKVAELRAKTAPALREKMWKKVTNGIDDSPVSLSRTWQYRMELSKVRDGAVAAIGEFLSNWKVKSEEKPDEQTVVLFLGPKGLMALGFPYSGVMMFSRLQDGSVELRSKYWVYPPNENPNTIASARNALSTLVDTTLGKPLLRQLGEPVKSSNSAGNFNNTSGNTVQRRDFSGDWSGTMQNTGNDRGIVGGSAGNYRLVISSDLKSGTYYYQGTITPVQITDQGDALAMSDINDRLKIKMVIDATGNGARVRSRIEPKAGGWAEAEGVFYRK